MQQEALSSLFNQTHSKKQDFRTKMSISVALHPTVSCRCHRDLWRKAQTLGTGQSGEACKGFSRALDVPLISNGYIATCGQTVSATESCLTLPCMILCIPSPDILRVWGEVFDGFV